jgi:hypothetical protein
VDTARAITDDWSRDKGLAGIATTVAATDPDRALDTARAVTHDESRDKAGSVGKTV